MESIKEPKSQLLGDVQFGQGCFFSNTCLVEAREGPILLGDFNILEEKVHLLNTRKEPMLVGSHNHFQIAARVENSQVGSCNQFEPRSVCLEAQVDSHCQLGATAELRGGRLAEGRRVVPGRGEVNVLVDGEQQRAFVTDYFNTLKDSSTKPR